MSFANLAESRIREAMENGEFKDLPGMGKPIDLSDYEKMPEDLRMGYGLLKSNGFRPPEVDLLREIQQLKDRLASEEGTNDGAEERLRLLEEIAQREVTLDLKLKALRKRGGGIAG